MSHIPEVYLDNFKFLDRLSNDNYSFQLNDEYEKLRLNS